MDKYTTRIPPRSTAARKPAPVPSPDIEEDERYYLPARTSSSARRYVNTEGHEVIEQGNRGWSFTANPHRGDTTGFSSWALGC